VLGHLSRSISGLHCCSDRVLINFLENVVELFVIRVPHTESRFHTNSLFNPHQILLLQQVPMFDQPLIRLVPKAHQSLRASVVESAFVCAILVSLIPILLHHKHHNSSINVALTLLILALRVWQAPLSTAFKDQGLHRVRLTDPRSTTFSRTFNADLENRVSQEAILPLVFPAHHILSHIREALAVIVQLGTVKAFGHEVVRYVRSSIDP